MNLKSAIAATAILATSTGCAVHKATISSYVDPTYQTGGVESIAVFPIRNARAAPGEAQMMNRRLAQEVARRSPSVRIVDPTSSVELLNENDVANEWAIFYAQYVTGGIPDSDRLMRIGRALDVDAVLQGEVVGVYQLDGQWASHQGQTRVTVRFSLLDARTGTLAWEASADGIRKTALNTGSAPPIIEAVNLAVDKLLENMPRLGR